MNELKSDTANAIPFWKQGSGSPLFHADGIKLQLLHLWHASPVPPRSRAADVWYNRGVLTVEADVILKKEDEICRLWKDKTTVWATERVRKDFLAKIVRCCVTALLTATTSLSRVLHVRHSSVSVVCVSYFKTINVSKRVQLYSSEPLKRKIFSSNR